MPTNDQLSSTLIFIAIHSTPKAMSLDEIKQATKLDKTLQKLAELLRTNKINGPK